MTIISESAVKNLEAYSAAKAAAKAYTEKSGMPAKACGVRPGVVVLESKQNGVLPHLKMPALKVNAAYLMENLDIYAAGDRP